MITCPKCGSALTYRDSVNGEWKIVCFECHHAFDEEGEE